MKLGEMLLRDGRITPAHLQDAVSAQAREGGRLGSLLVELGHIDAETLTIYLGLELGMPIATGATLERCKRSAVRLLTPQQAARYHCVPIVIQGQTLIVAIDDPHDMQALDALHQITGYRILPRIAPEIRIHYYLERFYGVPRPPRFRALGEQPRGNASVGSHTGGLPGPPLPGLPPRRDTPVVAPTPAPPLRRTQPKLPVVQEHEALELDANDLVDELDSDEAETASAAPPAPAATAEDARADAARSRPARTTGIPRFDLDTALRQLATTEQRGTVADALLGYAVDRFEVAVLCLVRDSLVVGWKGFGPGLDVDRIETLLVPLDGPSIFQIAYASRDVYRGPVAPTTLHEHVAKVLRTQAPSAAVIVPITIGPRVVNVLYAHRTGGGPIDDAEHEALRKLARAASEAYVRLISESKRKQAGGAA